MSYYYYNLQHFIERIFYLIEVNTEFIGNELPMLAAKDLLIEAKLSLPPKILIYFINFQNP